MASFVVHLVFVVLVLSIAVDFFSQGRNVFDSSSDSIAAQSSHYFSGASADGFQSGEAADAEISKSAKRAAKKKKKDEERVKGEERNKEKKEEGKEHTKNKRPSTRNKHEKNQARQQREQKKSNKKKQ